MKKPTLSQFKKTIWDYYNKQKREFAWRDTRDPYKIVVSEIMLQQTQVHRVIPKYEQFIAAFPDFKTLAAAPLSRVLAVWEGMGYNRRALYLKKIAEMVIDKYQGTLPRSIDELDALPGIAAATASSISAFSYNTPVVFIETNIRTVFIHFFFHSKEKVSDKDIMPLVEKTLDKTNPREWYFALMDYGTYLKKTLGNKSRQSAHYIRQSKFEGSSRQLRGQILRLLLKNKMTLTSLSEKLHKDETEILTILRQLQKEKLIEQKNKTYIISSS